MDPITHALGGGLIAKTTGTSRARFWIMCFLGEAPDLDVFLAKLGPWAFVLQHRGLTHSITGVILQAIFFSWVFGRWDPDTFKRRTLLYSLPLSFHLLCDFLTSYGVPLFSPFSLKNYQGDLVTSVNLIPMVFTLAVLIWMKRQPRSEKMAFKVGWTLWGAYFLFSLSLKSIVASRGPWFESTLRETVVPTLANPMTWSIVLDDPADTVNYRCMRYNLTTGERSPLTVNKPYGDQLTEASRQAPLVQKFFKENRWPVTRILQERDRTIVDWGSLLFSTRGLVRAKVRVELDEKGSIIDAQRYFGFWNPEDF